MKMQPSASLIAFPCDFPVKILGRSEAEFAQAMLAIILRHAPDFDAATMEMRSSSRNNYLSLTCVIHATSQAQLDSLYRELCAQPMVVMVL
jgi:uncharacterized protein